MPLPELNISKEQLTPKQGTLPKFKDSKEDLLPKRPEGKNITKEQEKILREEKLQKVDKEQLRRDREEKAAKRKQAREDLQLKKTIAAAQEAQTSTTSEEEEVKISQLILDKVRNLAAIALPAIVAMGKEAGLDFAQDQLSNSCPSPATLQKLKNLRDNIERQLSGVAVSLDVTKQLLDTLQKFIDGTIDTVQAIDLSQVILSGAAKVIPSPPGIPGIITSSLTDLQLLKDDLIFTTLGGSKLEAAKGKLGIGLGLFGQASGIVNLLLSYLDPIDRLLERCGQQVTPINATIRSIAIASNRGAVLQAPSGNYKGFTLTVEEKEFSPTIKQVRGVALNGQGIPVLYTDYSFTTIPQLLINQLKFTIDSQNLKPF